MAFAPCSRRVPILGYKRGYILPPLLTAVPSAIQGLSRSERSCSVVRDHREAAMSPSFPRRTLLRGAALGAGGVSVSAILAACGGGSGSTSGSGNTGGKTVTLGSNASDEVPRKA